MKRTTSVFTSKTKRLETQTSSVQAANIVQYDNQANTIALNAKKKVETTNNPLLANLQGKNHTTMAFLSNAPRFGGQNSDDSEAFLGPGYYEQRSQFTEHERLKHSQAVKGAQMQLVNGVP